VIVHNFLKIHEILISAPKTRLDSDPPIPKKTSFETSKTEN